MSSGPFTGWEALWPEISAEVERKVRRKLPPGVEPSDVSNEVAARLLAATNVPPADRLRFWCLAVARCVVADLYRRRVLNERDLPIVISGDVEQLALARMRLRSVLESISTLPEADRDALAARVGPLSDSVKARRKRARKRMKDRMLQSVGSGVALPKLRWLFASGVVAAALPFSAAAPWWPPGTDGMRIEPEAGVAAAVETGVKLEPSGIALASPAPPTPQEVSNLGPGPIADAFQPAATLQIPGAGETDAGTFDDDAYGPGPPPLACARNLRVADDVCIDHPLR